MAAGSTPTRDKPRVDVGPKSPRLTTGVPPRVRLREQLKLDEGGDDVTLEPRRHPGVRSRNDPLGGDAESSRANHV